MHWLQAMVKNGDTPSGTWPGRNSEITDIIDPGGH